MEKWLSELKIDERSSVTVKVPQEAKGMGLTDAPRGALGHWISIKGGGDRQLPGRGSHDLEFRPQR